jgi:hypothetical protein
MKLEEVASEDSNIIAVLRQLNIHRASTIQTNGTVDVDGDVRLLDHWNRIPVEFGRVSGTFGCCQFITSLKGSPKYVGQSFLCTNSRVTSLEFAPLEVGEDVHLNGTPITSLQHSPSFIGRGLFLGNTGITTLKGAPSTIFGTLECSDTPLVSLDYAPKHIAGSMWIRNTRIRSLHDIHKTHSDWEIKGTLHLPRRCTNILSLAYIPGINTITLGTNDMELSVIHDVHEWQEKLLDLGLMEQAQL